ncbi:MAG TPA: hypothetical protein VMZ28_00595 [Kofleriaceae bacterium]|nr:hypothetical protein [Kofleriaceae bacterium]
MSRRTWSWPALALLAPLGCAAAPPAPPASPALAPAMRSLAFYVGEWDCQGTIYDGGKPQPPLPYHVSVHPILDGSWLEVKFYQGDELIASELKGYDESARRYRHIGGTGGGASFSSSADGWQGDHMVFHDDHPLPGEHQRTVFTHLSDTRYSHRAEADTGAGFEPDFEKTCEKR